MAPPSVPNQLQRAVRYLTSEIIHGDHDTNNARPEISAGYGIAHSMSTLFITLQNIVSVF